MKKTRVAGAMLATAVALAFTASLVSAEDTPSAATQGAQIKCLGANACKGKGYIITADAQSCEAAGGHAGKKPPMPGM